MENALVGDEEEPEPLQQLGKIKSPMFGLKFEDHDGHGGKVKTWPTVAHCDFKDKSGARTIASEFPSITPGCRITKINGEPAPSTFKEAAPKLKKLPLDLEFTTAVAQSTAVVQPWLCAGLLEIGLVRRHETAKLLRHRKECGNNLCNRPHCAGGCCTPARACEEDHEHDDRCTIRRQNSHGWIKFAEVRPDAESKIRSLQKRVASMAAKDAFRDAIALVRAHEDKSGLVANAVPPTAKSTPVPIPMPQPEPEPETMAGVVAVAEGVPPRAPVPAARSLPRWPVCLCAESYARLAPPPQ